MVKREKLIYLLLIIYPFGQLMRFRQIVFLDVVIFLIALPFIFKVKGLIKYVIYYLILTNFIAYFVTSSYDWLGILYLVRLIFYTLLALALGDYFGDKSLAFKKKMLKMFLIVFFYVATFGWIQYLWLPDLRRFTVFGWDDQLFRLAGTFFDPGFTAIILVLGLTASTALFLKNKIKIYLWLSLFLGVSIIFTYSRAGYLAMFVGLTYLFFKLAKLKYLFLGILLFGLTIFLLPQRAGEGVNLARLYSIYDRVGNYKETLQVFEKYPLTGVGYDNLCVVRKNEFNFREYGENSCSGSDSGMLLILATTGVVGLYLAIVLIRKIWMETESNLLGEIFRASFLALFVNGQIINSIFYPWILTYMIFLGAISRKKSN